ncbi:dinucleotide-utilizing protein [Burkholderia ubonensis]|uniref:PRTRC system ThiF family protein n=1 Tax=Burkholderia ubonensis TaxID=101571 RepID=UPI000752BFC0|nr:PRTRC system ThiF family protein [Burkholderia ubonensis]KVC60529.1 dinucleotide-utilizing protein [Burkholderia ubonensis]
MTQHKTPARFLSDRRVTVALIGCGGTGSQMLTGLARLNHALVELGHPGLHVTAFDADTVSAANVGRQMFSPTDVGQRKSVVLVHRLNAFFGLDWCGRPVHAGADAIIRGAPDLVVMCVDSAVARAKLAPALKKSGSYVMDLGNRASDGQVILGASAHAIGNRASDPVDSTPLRWPYDVLPELVDTTTPEDDTPSCSLAEALERQELFINQAVVTQGLAILWEFFRHARLTWCGAFVNLKTGNVRPMVVQAPQPTTKVEK